MPEDRPIDHVIKVLLVGDSGVGKSSILQRFVKGTFQDQQPTTIGVDFSTIEMELYNKRVKLMIWDTAGQEKFRALTSTFYRGAKGVILVYDVTRASTLNSLSDYWLQELDMYASSAEPVRMIIANKVDMGEQREVSWAQGMDFAKACGSLFVEASAKSGVAISTAFEELVLKILESPSLMSSGPSTDASGVKLKAEGGGGSYSTCYSC